MRKVSAIAALFAACALHAGPAQAASLSGTYISARVSDHCKSGVSMGDPNFGAKCSGVNIRLQRSGSSWIGKVVHVTPSSPSVWKNRGNGWIAINVRHQTSCMAGDTPGALLYGSVFDKARGTSQAGYLLAVDNGGAGANVQLYLMPGVREPVLPGGQCNNRATYGKDQFFMLTRDTTPLPWHRD